MKMKYGWVRLYFSDRGHGRIRESLTGIETFFHHSDFEGDPASIVEQMRVQYEVVQYIDRKNQPRTKAVHIQLVPAAPAVKP
jgi:cold shock CspA family protein